MAVEVEFTDEFEVWWDSLTGKEQDSVGDSVNMLRGFGMIIHQFSGLDDSEPNRRNLDLSSQEA